MQFKNVFGQAGEQSSDSFPVCGAKFTPEAPFSILVLEKMPEEWKRSELVPIKNEVKLR